MELPKDFSDVVEQAIKKHRKLLRDKVLELVLGEMIAEEGIGEVISRLEWWADHLSEFHSE